MDDDNASYVPKHSRTNINLTLFEFVNCRCFSWSSGRVQGMQRCPYIHEMRERFISDTPRQPIIMNRSDRERDRDEREGLINPRQSSALSCDSNNQVGTVVKVWRWAVTRCSRFFHPELPIQSKLDICLEPLLTHTVYTRLFVLICISIYLYSFRFVYIFHIRITFVLYWCILSPIQIAL